MDAAATNYTQRTLHAAWNYNWGWNTSSRREPSSQPGSDITERTPRGAQGVGTAADRAIKQAISIPVHTRSTAQAVAWTPLGLVLRRGEDTPRALGPSRTQRETSGVPFDTALAPGIATLTHGFRCLTVPMCPIYIYVERSCACLSGTVRNERDIVSVLKVRRMADIAGASRAPIFDRRHLSRLLSIHIVLSGHALLYI